VLHSVLCASCICEQQRQRQKLLSEVCAKYFPSSSETGGLRSTYVNVTKGIILCQVRKVYLIINIIIIRPIIVICPFVVLLSLFEYIALDYITHSCPWLGWAGQIWSGQKIFQLSMGWI